MDRSPSQPSGDSRAPLLSTHALLLLVTTGLVIAAAIAWPQVGVAVTVGVAVLAVLLVITRPSSRE
jgi:hypothetical protein